MANEFKVRKGLVVNGSGSVILDVQGSQGQLFSVTDQLSGSLFSVNDISGVPVLEAFSDSTVKIGQYLSEAIVVSGSTARITGSIAMAGFSSGSVLFAGPGGSITEDNTGLFWDNINNRLGIGTNAPARSLDVRGAARIETASTTELDLIGGGGNILRVSCGASLPFVGTLTSTPFGLFTAANERARIFATGNFAIGGTSDSGERLQVSGSSRFMGNMVITGSGATSATYAFTVQNSNGANILRTRSDGAVYIESVGSVAQLFFSGNDAQIQRSTSGLNGLGMYGPANASHTLTISSFSSDNYQNGALSSLRFSGNFISSTGNTAFSYMLLNGTINQTGTSTSTIRGLYINPTITSASNFRAVEWSNNAATSPSQSWGLYGAGTAPNYLNGSLGIGTTSPAYLLDVSGSARLGINRAIVYTGTINALQLNIGTTFGGNLILINGSTGAGYVGIDGTGAWGWEDGSLTLNANTAGKSIILGTQAIQKLKLFSTGNVLIQNGGTFTDDGVNRLQVSGSAKITNGLVVTGSISNFITGSNYTDFETYLESGAGGGIILRRASDGFAGRIYWNATYNFPDNGGAVTFGGNSFTHQSGLVNIRTTQPRITLMSNSNLGRGFYITAPTANNSFELWLHDNYNQQNQRQLLGISNTNDFTFYQSGSGNTLLYVSSSGNVGIGTNTPMYSLDTSGSARITNGLSVTGSITANDITVTGTLTAQTIVAQTITSSILYSSGSNIFGNSLSNTQDFTGSVRITGSLSLPYLSTGSVLFVGADRSVSQNNSNFFWDNTNNALAIGGTTIDANIALQINSIKGVKISGSGGGFGYQIVRGTETSAFSNNGSATNISSTNTLIFNTGGSESARFNSSQRLLIGTTSDTGERLQVSGSSKFVGNMTITGSINVSSLITLGQAGATSPIIYSFLNNGYSSPNPTGLNLGYFNYTTTQTGTQYHFALAGNQFNPTSGDHTGLFYARTFAPSSGTATFQSVLLRPTISQSSATGVTAGIIINPILTSAADWRSIMWVNDTGFGLYGSGTAPNFLSGSLLIGSTTNTGERLQVTGTARITQALTASAALISGSGTQRLTVVGSGSAQPLFTVQGSQGELFSIVDSLSGSLFSVNDQSGLPIMEVFSDNTILMGNYLDPMLLTTARTSSAAGINTLYTLPTSSYDAVYIDYTIRSGSNARAGNFMAMWSGTSVNFTDNSITEFGTTSGFVFGAHISGSNMVVTGSSSTAGWTVKTIIKAI